MSRRTPQLPPRKRRSPVAKALRTPKYRQRIVPSKIEARRRRKPKPDEISGEEP